MDADTVVVTGTGRASAVPDALVLNLQLQGHGRAVGDALAMLTRASQACHDALPDHRLRTHGLGLHSRQDREGRQVGHTAYQSLQVRTGDPAGAGDLVHRLSEAVGDGLSVQGLDPELTDTSAQEEQARRRAFDDARTRAEQYAALAHRSLGPVVRVREAGAAGPRPMESRMLMAGATDGPPTDVADHVVVTQVEVTWKLGGCPA